MDHPMLVRNMFNDMYVFFNGTEPMGLDILQDVYQDEPLFLAFIGSLDEALKVPYNDVMKECYGFYKQYCGKELTDTDWDHVVTGIQEYNQKWQNPWCQSLILALLELLEREEKDRKGLLQEGQEEPPSETMEAEEALEQDYDPNMEYSEETENGMEMGESRQSETLAA